MKYLLGILIILLVLVVITISVLPAEADSECFEAPSGECVPFRNYEQKALYEATQPD